MKLDHVALAVENLENALETFGQGLGLHASHIEEIADQEVRIAFLPLGDTEIELLEPMSDVTGVARFLEKRGEGLHHICLQVDDLEATLHSLKSKGYRLIDESPREGGQGKRIAFLHPKSTHGVLLELCEVVS